MTSSPPSKRLKSSDSTASKISEAHLSSLPDDCISDIFGRVDHIDLDELATTSKRFQSLTNVSREIAVKVEATKLIVCQFSSQLFNFTMIYEGEEYFLQFTKETFGTGKKMIRRKITKYARGAQLLPTEQTSTFHDRFAYEKIIFDSVSLDDNFLVFLGKIASVQCFKSLTLMNCKSDDSLSNDGVKSFENILLTSSPRNLILDIDSDTPFINQEFLKSYADHTPNAKVTIKLPTFPMVEPDQYFAQSLSKFVSLEMRTLLVNGDWIMNIIVERLFLRQAGRWRFAVSRAIDELDVRAAMRPETDYGFGGNDIGISYTGTNHRVSISAQDLRGAIEMLEARFYVINED